MNRIMKTFIILVMCPCHKAANSIERKWLSSGTTTDTRTHLLGRQKIKFCKSIVLFDV